jgi:hypothetical protein
VFKQDSSAEDQWIFSSHQADWLTSLVFEPLAVGLQQTKHFY